MADALVSIALEKLTDILGQQLSLFAGASDELERLKDSLESIRAVLADAESRQVAERSAQLWLSRLRDVAYDIENVLNEWLISGLEKDDDDDDGDAANRVRAPACLPSPHACLDRTVSRYTVARSIKEIRERLDQIAKEKDQFNTSQISNSSGNRRPVRSRTLTTSHMEEKMIGREDDKDAVISRLVSGSSGDDGQVQVIAIVGIGGLGKTTLARNIYHDDKVRNHFEKFLWVCVSEDFDVERLTKEMVEQVIEDSISLSQLEMLQNKLLEELRGKHFLLVLDDVWNADKEKWKRLRSSLTSGAPGSRILITTRLKMAADTMNAAYAHDLKGLSNDHTWMLFINIAFDGREAEEHSQLESIGREIVNKCKGVPLSITVMGSVMNSKQTVEDWQNILDSNMWSLPKAGNKILPALWLSYNNLPPHLKQCFVYCSIYEKDKDIYKDKLVQLWIAQGFVQSQGNRDIEDIGIEYFEDLVAWSMFQEVEEDDEGKITCKMHDLLHDLAEFIMKDETYIYRSENSNRCSTKIRHASLILSENGPSIPIPPHGRRKLRTLFLDGDYKIDTVLLDLFRQARFLMTLVFCKYQFKILPKTIGKLKHLRYLDLSNSELAELPNAIGKLKQLKCLNLSGSKIVEWPSAVGKMKQLRHLDLSGTGIVELSESVCYLRNLHTLNLNSCYELKKLPRGLGEMVSLRHLKIEDTDDLDCLPTGMGRITSLRSLSKFMVGGEGGCGIDELQRLNSLQGDIEIIHLERVSSGEEARRAELWNKPHLHKLILEMSGRDEEIAMSGRDAETERMNSVLESLRPHASIEQLELDCNRRSSKLPSWMEHSSFSKLTKLTVAGFIYCDQNLPGFGKLPNLKSLEIRDVGVKKMGHELYHGSNSNDAVGRCVAAFPKLEELILEDMHELEEWELTSEADANVMPSLCFLRLQSCPELEGLPRHLAKSPLKRLEMSNCPRIKGTGCFGFPLLEEFSLLDSSEFLSTGLPELPNLKDFRITDLGNETVGDGGWDLLAALQKLEIRDCNELKCLPDSLAELESLEQLEIGYLQKLQSLPEGLGQLNKLKSLQIIGVEALICLPNSLGQLELLESLQICDLNKLESLPEELGQLKKLKSLEIRYVEALICLPNSLGQLESLKSLEIGGLKKLESLPEGLGQLKKLKSLVIRGAEALICLPNSLGQLESLQSLEIDDLKRLESLPEELGQLKKLKSLEITHMEALICLPNYLGQLESLESLEIKGLKKLESLPEGLGQLKKLKSLVIRGAEVLICLPNSLGQLESLESLRINYLEKLESLPEGMGQLKKLKSLEITDLEALICLPNSLGQLESLESLRINDLEKLESLPEELGQLKKLKSLVIRGAEALICLPEELGQLNRAEVMTCLPDSVGQLDSLEISHCKKLKSLPGRMGQLKSLDVGYLEALTRPPDMIGRLKSLERLGISGWKELESLPRWIGRLKSLRKFSIYNCTALRSLPHGLQDLPLLRELWIGECPLLSERCKREGGEDWPKISRIPRVYIDGRRNY